MISRGIARIVAPLMCVALAGCQFGTDVKVEGTAPSPLILVRKSGLMPFGTPIFRNLDVSIHGGDHQTVWRVHALDPFCHAGGSRIIYGQVPDGYEANGETDPLVEGGVYDVFIDGCSPVGTATFQIVKGRVVPR